jgi:hypothetical protein
VETNWAFLEEKDTIGSEHVEKYLTRWEKKSLRSTL